MAGPLTISVLASCTGHKAPSPGPMLSHHDFALGPEHVASWTSQRNLGTVPAESLYRGQQHLRLMRGVTTARNAGHAVSLSIASAGYGLLKGETAVAPYECTFQGMSSAERRAWARRLELPSDTQRLLRRTADLAVVLLGEDYFDACGLGDNLELGAPTFVICGAKAALRLQPNPAVHALVLHRHDTRRFRCGTVGLKGEVAGRLLVLLAQNPELLTDLLGGSTDDLLDAASQQPIAKTSMPLL